MKLIGQIVALLFAIALLAAIGFGIYLGFEYVVALFDRLDYQVAIVTGIACVVALASSFVIARAIRTATYERKTIALREEKAATYQLLLDYWENLLGQKRERTNPLPAEMAEKLKVLDRLLALYGGTAVIRAHTAMRDFEGNSGARNAELRGRLGEAVVAIRKDLGADTPRDIAGELERLLLPSVDDSVSNAETSDSQSRTVLASNC